MSQPEDGSLRSAICNEIFGREPLDRVCRSARLLGYRGLELAPHTIAEDATHLSGGERGLLRRQISEEGLEFVGLHWLLVSPPGFHITSPDTAIRRRTWDYVHRAIDLCADLAENPSVQRPVIVFGSPKQRSATGSITPQDAVNIFTEYMKLAAVRAAAAGVTLLIEAIPSAETNVINTLAEAVAMVDNIGQSSVQTMFDVHNSLDETLPHSELLRRYFAHVRHVHVNEVNGQEPGMGNYDFNALLATLANLHYGGWISVEAFDFSRPPEEIAQRALQTLTASLVPTS